VTVGTNNLIKDPTLGLDNVLRHRWGSTIISKHWRSPGHASIKVITEPKLEGRLIHAREQYGKSGFTLAEWMLAHWTYPGTDKPDQFTFDMQREFEHFVDELAKRPNMDAKDQSKVQALLAVREALNKDAAQPDDELARLAPIIGDGYNLLKSKHYVLLHQPRDDKAADRQIHRFEKAYAACLYWAALKGQTAIVPQKRLIVVMAESKGKFDLLHKAFDNVPMTADGFYDALDNVAVISRYRLDASYEQFQTMANDLEKRLGDQFPMEKLLKGDFKLSAKQLAGDGDVGVQDINLGKVVALAGEAAREEGEIHAVTHEAAQQLAVATGMLPRRVKLPQSVRFGVAAFMESAKSSGDLDSAALWSGLGGHHWTYLPFVKKLLEAESSGAMVYETHGNAEKKIKVPKLGMIRILTDGGFDQADKADKAEQEVYVTKARAEAWSLMAYLMKEKSSNWARFCQELSQCPPDMDLSQETIELAFGRAFDLTDPASDKIDPAKLQQLESSWRSWLGVQNLEVNTHVAASSSNKKNKHSQ